VIVVRLVVVERNSRFSQQESASACLGRCSHRPPPLGWAWKGDWPSEPTPHSALPCSHWSTREVRGAVLMVHHHQIVSNPRTRECGERASEPSWCGGEERGGEER
jgi:hypothetical protein